jgi:Nuclease-related domain
VVPVVPAAPVADVAGGSARHEYEKRSARELAKKQMIVAEDAAQRQALVAARPVVGRIVSALTPKPTIGPESQPTRAWRVGAEGEQRVAEVLAEVVGIVMLHDRLVPGSRASNIDHIAIGPSGVFVIDAKKYSGRVEVKNVGSVFRPDERLYVNGRDRSKTVSGVQYQVDVVREALSGTFHGVTVSGVLCFVEADWGFPMRSKWVEGVTALWPKALPQHVTTAGPHSEVIDAIADHLRACLKPAT